MSYHRSKTSILSSLDNEYIEEGRQDIYKWGESRYTRRQGIRGWAYAFKKLFIDKSILRSFLNNLTVSLLIQLILSGLFTYTCQTLDLYIDVHIALFVSPIIFPLAFSINADFQRREHVLEDLALFKGGLIVMFFCHRDWHVPAGLSQEFLKAVTNKLKGLILNVKEYLLTEDEGKRSFILQVIYEDFSDISQMNEKIRVALPDSASLIQRVIHCHNLMFWAFERLRVVREYRSPRGIRSFTKVFIFVMPLLLSPYYVFVGKASNNKWGPYYISLISTFVFGTLQGVQDVLDDPFDGISEDDVNLGSLEDWTAHSLLTNRTYTVGRFTVTASINQKDETKEASSMEARHSHEAHASFKKRVPLRSILRRASQRTSTKDRPDRICKVSEDDVDILYPEMALRLQNVKKKGFAGNTTILPGFQLKENPQDNDNEDNSILGTPVSIERSASDLTEEVLARRRAFRKNVSFSRDLDEDTSEDSHGRTSESSLHENDSFPLLSDRHPKIGFNSVAKVNEPDPDKLSKDLLQSFKRLENSSATERIQTKPSSKDEIPASLSALFNPLSIQEPTDSAEQPVSSSFAPVNEDNEPSPVNPKQIALKNLLSDEASSLSDNSVSTNRPSRFEVTPSTQATSNGASKPSRFNVTHITQPSSTSSLSDNSKEQIQPKNKFEVKSASSATLDDDQVGESNLGLSSSESLFIEDRSAVNQKASQTPSRFTVKSDTKEKSHEDSMVPQVDRTLKNRQNSFWDFSEDDISADGELPKTLNSKESHATDVLDLPEGCSGEVYI